MKREAADPVEICRSRLKLRCDKLLGRCFDARNNTIRDIKLAEKCSALIEDIINLSRERILSLPFPSDLSEKDRGLSPSALRMADHKAEGEELVLLRRLADASGNGFCVADLKGNIIYVNRALCHLLDEPDPDAVLGKNIISYYPVEVQEALGIDIISTAATKGQWVGELPLLSATGSIIPTIQNFFVVHGEMGTAPYLANLIMDISDRERAVEALRQSEEKYRDLVENMSDIIYAVDTTGVITYISPVAESVIGYTEAELIGRPFFGIFHEEDLGDGEKAFRKILSGQLLEPNEYRMRTKSGNIHWLRVSGRPFFVGNRIVGIQGTLADVTERKQAEEMQRIQRDLAVELGSSREKGTALRRIMDVVIQIEGIDSGGIYLVDQQSGNLVLRVHSGFGSAFVDRVSNIDADSPQAVSIRPGKPFYRSHDTILSASEPHMLDEDLRAAAVIPIMAGGELIGSFNLASHIHQEIPLASRCALEAIAAQIGDVIQRLHAEEALRESERRLELALKTANLGLWDWNVPTGEMGFDERWADILGYLPEEIEPHVQSRKRLIHPDDFPRVEKVLRAHIEGHTQFYEAEMRMLTKTGEWKWILDRGKVVTRDSSGGAIRAIGTHLDITERKWGEEGHSCITRILESMGNPVVVTDSRGIVQYVNPAMERMIGRTSGRVQGERAGIFLDRELDQELYENAKRRSMCGRIRNVAFALKKEDGTSIDVEATITPVRHAPDGPVHYVSTMCASCT